MQHSGSNGTETLCPLSSREDPAWPSGRIYEAGNAQQAGRGLRFHPGLSKKYGCSLNLEEQSLQYGKSDRDTARIFVAGEFSAGSPCGMLLRCLPSLSAAGTKASSSGTLQRVSRTAAESLC